ncbi:neuron navigator 1 isoform X1 [Terrapene carolina triunguis]|uniref:neuron navigator 1 isoform X1 n=2 Tax=Terrapene triunguis TaxID=2587831 RepID=UPI000E774C24|nr:neuron navigator 1 isoform X1 [Terrapene carolina triunguis]XP_024073798.2 neuron navigator 1 isoform X1 [Terrapene carolina triunguis]
MNGTANVNVTGRSHYASAIPVPRAMSQSKLPPRQSSLGAPPSQRAASPRPGKAPGCVSSPAAKGSKPKSLSKGPMEAGPGPETAEPSECKRADGVESGLSQSTRTPGSSPRGGPKTTPRATGAPKKALVQGTEREKESPKPGEAYSSHGAKKGSGKPSGTAELAKTPQLQGKSPSRFSLCSESGLPGTPEGSSAKRPQSCPVKGQWVSEALWKGSGVPKAARGEDKSPGILLGTSSPMQNKEPAISFSSVPQQSHPVTATVAPFHYRLQGDREKSEFSQEERACEELTSPADGPELGFPGLAAGVLNGFSAGGMLGTNLKSLELSGEGPEELKGYRKGAEGKGGGMMPKRPKAPGAHELRVFKSGSVESRLPPGPSLRKQKSLTNLAFLTDAEKKMQLYEPRWSDDMAKAAKGGGRGGLKAKEAPLMSKSLSKSEHSLFQARLSPGLAKPPLAPLPSSLGKPSRIPRGPYAEVKPLSKAPEAGGAEDSKSDDEILSSKAKGREKPQQQPAPAPGPAGKGQDERAYLKVDPELVVTVLGDLEQLLFSQMLDPESQRKRTVQNVLDLRQNLEETMSSLRGSQVSHSSLEMTCYDSDEANPRSVSSLSNRSSPLSWRYGQSSPRLQAGDAPSVGGSCRSEGTPSWYMHGERAHYSHTMPMRSPSKLSHISRLELVESLDADDVDLKSGYMSDSDLMGKTLTEDDDITTGWDESSSISSGLSDASDNLSSEEFNASSSLNSLPSSPTASRRNSAIALRTDSEKRSLAESGLSWYSEAEEKGPKKLDYDSGSLKMEHGASKWRRERAESCDEAPAKGGELKKPVSLGPPGSLKKGKTPPVAVTSPITHTAQSTLKVAGKPEAKATDKSKLSVKNAGLQRSSSDAGRDRIGDAKKPPSGLARPSTSGSFGYKKPPPATGTATVMQAGGSATLGKIQKSSGIPVKPVNGRKTSLDVSNAGEPGFLAPGARSNIQYRSLPRPAKSSSMSVTGGRGGNRPVSSSIDPSLLSTKQGGISVSRLKEPSKIGTSRSTPAPVNQTDREKEKAKAKAVALDSECVSLKSIGSPESTPKAQASHLPAAKVAELPPTPLRAPAKSYVKPPSLANLDKVNSNSLDLPSSNDLPQPHASKRQDLHPAAGHLTPCFAPSPAPILNINSASFSQGLELMSGFSVPKEGRMYPKLSGLHRSMESLQMPISLPSAFSGSSTTTTTPAPAPTPPISTEEETSEQGWTGSPRAAHLDSTNRDRNTLPKKGLRYQLQSQEETKERRHSHTIGGLPESDDQSELPSPPALSVSLAGKSPLTNIVSPTAATTPRITRSNSIPTHDSAFELYSTSQMGSTLSLADRPKGMIRSGSFRDPADDVHGSVLSLASSASSTYSSAEERMQSEQIRKLRRELESSQEKVATLTSQLSANANLVAAFEQSLVNMTSRLRQLAETAEEKDTELVDLRETIDFLKKKNSEAQAVIQGALNGTDITPKELRIKRQNSSDSISSLNSITSHSSIGSGKDADAKKKKKKSWLRSSFNKAFSIKKGPKSASSYSDIEEIATPDSSAPSSPKLQHGSTETASPSIKSSNSSSVGIDATELFQANEEEEEPEKKEVSELRSELWEKEMKLTDIRLEALNSAHQLDQLRETMHNMQLEVDLLKAENDRLKVVPGPSSVPGSIPGHLRSTSASSSPRRSLGLALAQSFSPGLADTDLSPMDAVGAQKDEVMLRIVVRMPPQHIIKGDLKQQEFFLGCSKVSGKVDWKTLDEAVCQVFKDYVTKMDPASTLGLSTESVHGYSISHVKRVLDTEPPELPPCRRGVTSIAVVLKGLKEKCVDSLVFETLIPKPMMQHYISLLLKHRRLILSGPSGTGKTYLTNRLAEYLVERSGREVTEGIVNTFNMHQQSCKDLQLYLSNLANQIDRETGIGDVPLVILLDDLSEAGSISELVNGALTCKYHKCPYIIGTTNQPVKMTPNHGLHLSFRMLTFSNNVEPANGFLVRYLRRKLLESDSDINANRVELLRVLDWVPKLWYHLHTFLEKHSTSDFLIGPCFFLSCPIGIEDFRTWFIDLWNNSIIPYLQEGAKDGIKVHGQKAAWEDPVEWVRDTLPWPSAQQDQSKLYHLPPPSVGPHTTASPPEERTVKDTTPSSLDSDPLMAMLLKLQEAANYIESPDRETLVDPNLQPTP